jgi:hypothetical protein
MTDRVVARLAAILASSRGRADVFAKVGDSITVSDHFFKCFGRHDVRLGDHAALEPTLAFFERTRLEMGTSSFDRSSYATHVGWAASDAHIGSPSPIDREVRRIRPAFAVVMFGTNGTYPTGFASFERHLAIDVDTLLGHGVVPLLSTIPPRMYDPETEALVPEMNAIVRAVAQAKQVPLMDYHATLAGLRDFGLMRDGVHPSVYLERGAHGCWLTREGLEHGMNQRNLIALQALDRARRFLVEREPPEPEPPALAGDGTSESPFLVPELPFHDDGDTTGRDNADHASYGCSRRDESGAEVVYQIALHARTRFRARLFADPGADLHLYWLRGSSGADCKAHDDELVELTAEPGTYRLVVDTRVSEGKVRAGRYRIVVVETARR